jgi:hypothetical protein
VPGLPSSEVRKTALALAFGACLLSGAAGAAAPATVEPDEAPPGSQVTITGPPGPVALEPIDGANAERLGATIPASGSIVLSVPQAPAGTEYRVVVPGAGEAPVLTVTEKLDERTSALLLGFGFVLLLGLAVGAVVVHRRWRDAIS